MSTMGLEGPHADTMTGVGSVPGGAERPKGDPGGIASAAASLTSVASGATTLAADIGSMASTVQGQWQGTASAAFGTEQQESASYAQRVAAFVDDIPAALTTYSQVLTAQQAAWDKAWADYQKAQTTAVTAAATPPSADPAAEQATADTINAANAAAAAALAAMKLANETAMEANETAASAVEKAGSDSASGDADRTSNTVKGLGYGVDGTFGVLEDLGEKIPGALPGAAGYLFAGGNGGADFLKKYDDNLKNDLMPQSQAVSEATADALGSATFGLGIAAIPGGGLAAVAGKSAVDFFGGNVVDDMFESGQDAPNISPSNLANPYSVGGVTPNHYDTRMTTAGPNASPALETVGAPHVDPGATDFPYGAGQADVPALQDPAGPG